MSTDTAPPDAEQEAAEGPSNWDRFVDALPTLIYRLAVVTIWGFGLAWSFDALHELAADEGFGNPDARLDLALGLPIALDVFAVGMIAAIAKAAIEGRSAFFARLVLVAAVSGMITFNVHAAKDPTPVDTVWAELIAAIVPLAAVIAFEFMAADLRRAAQVRRGRTVHAPLPTFRAALWLLAPIRTARTWKAEVFASSSALLPRRGWRRRRAAGESPVVAEAERIVEDAVHEPAEERAPGSDLVPAATVHRASVHLPVPPSGEHRARPREERARTPRARRAPRERARTRAQSKRRARQPASEVDVRRARTAWEALRARGEDPGATAVIAAAEAAGPLPVDRTTVSRWIKGWKAEEAERRLTVAS